LSNSEKEGFEKWLSEDSDDWDTYTKANTFIDSLVSEARSGQRQMP